MSEGGGKEGEEVMQEMGGGGGGFFFFFQAEDGIRDWSVTGVQTCALPIFGSSRKTTLGEPINAIAIRTLRFIPPL